MIEHELERGQQLEPHLVFRESSVETADGPRGFLIAEPRGAIVIDRARLTTMQDGDLLGATDVAILNTTRAARGRISAVVFRARGPEPGDQWCFSDTLGGPESTTLAGLFLRAHISMFQQMVSYGVVAVVGVDFRPRELFAYERASAKIVADLRQRLREPNQSQDLLRMLKFELWLVTRQAQWTQMPLERYVDRKLGEFLNTAERRMSDISMELSGQSKMR